MAIASASGGGSDPEDKEREPTKKAEPKKSAVRVNAADMVKEFEVSGRVTKVDTEVFNNDKHVLQIGGGGNSSS